MLTRVWRGEEGREEGRDEGDVEEEVEVGVQEIDM